MVEEPPLDSDIPERPCSVAYVQDDIYTHFDRKWADELCQTFPNRLGMTFAQFQWQLVKIDKGESVVDQGLEALQMDTAELLNPHIILIARGPLVSWIAQLYLESFHLAGLVLVDPLPMDNLQVSGSALAAVIQESTGVYNDHATACTDQYTRLLEKYRQGGGRSLRLEPGAVPTLVVQSIHHPLFADGAQQTADRHRFLSDQEADEAEERFVGGDVPIIQLFDDEKLDLQAVAKDEIGAWIERRVL